MSNRITGVSHLFPLSESMFYVCSRLQHVDSDMFVQWICLINNIRNNLDVFHYEHFTDYVVLVDIFTISSQCCFDYYTHVFGILPWNFVRHAYIAIQVINLFLKELRPIQESYREIFRKIFQSLWNLVVVSAAMLSRILSNFKAMRSC